MTRKTIIAIAVSAIAAAAWTSTASAAQKKTAIPAAHAAVQADQIQGVNPMLNSPPAAAVPNAVPYKPAPGVNPM